MIPTNCTWCESEQLIFYKNIISQYKDIKYSYYLCGNCGIKIAYTSNAEKNIDYDLIQKKHFGYNRHIADFKWVKSMFANEDKDYAISQIYDFLIHNTMDQRYISTIQHATEAYLKNEKLNILEIGCNLGYIGALFILQGHSYLGIDVQKNAINNAKDSFGDYFKNIALEDFEKNHSSKFDIICSFEVIEHIKNPREFIVKASNCLKDDGSIYVTTPDGSLIADKLWYSEYPPIHYSVFKKKTFQILEKNNFKVEFNYKNQLSFNLGFLNYLIKNNYDKSPAITDPDHKEFIYSTNKIKVSKLNYRKYRIKKFINLAASFLGALFNIAPPGGQIFIRIKKN